MLSPKPRRFYPSKTPQGIITIPLSDTKPMSQEEYEALSDEERKDLSKKIKVYRLNR
jgi:hypothetical protein